MNKGGDCIDEKQLAEVVNKKLSQRMDMTREYSDAELKKLIGLCVEKILEKIPQTDINPQRLATEVFNSRRRMGIIQPFMENPNVNEIMINGTDGIFIEINGMTEDAGVRYNSKEELFHNIQTMLSQSNRTVSESNPIADAVLPGGARINVVLNPVAVNGPIVTIRKFTKQQYTIEDFIRNGTLTAEMAEYVKNAVLEGKSIIISGSTSSGKTTFALHAIAEVQKESASILSLVYRLDELTQQTSVAASEQQEILAIIRALNTEVPGLSLSYDQLANKVSLSSDALMALVEAEITSRQYGEYYELLVDKMAMRSELENAHTEALKNKEAAYEDLLQAEEAYAKAEEYAWKKWPGVTPNGAEQTYRHNYQDRFDNSFLRFPARDAKRQIQGQ